MTIYTGTRLTRPLLLTSLLFAFACSSSSSGGFKTNGANTDTNGDGVIDNKDNPNGGIQTDTNGAAPPNCGNSALTADEACDDGNKVSGDGCAANCLSVELGFSCPIAGQACIHIARCGDGVVVAPEQCDDGNKNAGDGCSATCRYEPGYKCDGTPSVCTSTTCGDGKTEGAESCEDGNAMPFDGCSALCQYEPDCSAGACVSTCGDGVVVNEDCDDGNNTDGDGCSSSCKVEPGYNCASPALGDVMQVPLVARDFDAGGDFEKGSSFATGLNYANQGLLQDKLQGAKRKPTLASTTGTFNGTPGKDSGIASAASFAQWYDETAPAAGNKYIGLAVSTLNLYMNDAGTAYVNRFGKDGDGKTSAKYQMTATQSCVDEAKVAYAEDGSVMPCYACYYDRDPSTPQCEDGPQACVANGGKKPDSCALVNGTYMGTFIQAEYDGNPLFFPADSITPYNPSAKGQVSGNYNTSWPYYGDTLHNFSFTSEVRYWFQYDDSKTYSLRFVGDDDVWVFVNSTLAVDLGGIHTAVQGDLTITRDGATASVSPTNENDTGVTYKTTPALGLENGKVYEIVVLHAERQTTASSYQLTLSGFNAAASECKPVCGDGILGVGEQCDDGVNAGGYGKCGPGCVLGEFCGDGIVQEGEDCDDGNNLDGDDCGSACRDLEIIQ